MSLPSKSLRIGMFGGGVVGGGVYELLLLASSSTPTTQLTQHKIVHMCVSDSSKPRSFHVVDPSILTSNPEDIWKDKSLDCIVEVMGGTGLAKTVLTHCLKHKIPLITANKALLAQELDTLQQQQHTTNSSVIAFEAAVCGGIPIIHILQSSYAGDTIHSIQGICNGTTNYMLGKMNDTEYDQALQEAQELGYAEADPTADVEGYDVQAKICLLAKLAFGTSVPLQQISTKGISKLVKEDFEHATSMKSVIKLLGTAIRNTTDDNGNSVSVYVAPHLVPLNHPLARAEGSGNALVVESQNLGSCLYTGPGAGRYPTANSVVADIYRVAAGTASQPAFPLQTSYAVNGDYRACFYIRNPAAADPKVLEQAAVKHSIGLEVWHPGFVMTGECHVSQIEALCQDFGAPFFMPMIRS